MNLAQFPRRRYTEGFTPIEAVPRFSSVLGGPNIYIKRDDLLGLSAGLRTLVVCHCYREAQEVIRLISARKASKKEREAYGRRWRP